MLTEKDVLTMLQNKKYMLDCDIREDGRELRKILYKLLDEGKIHSIRYDKITEKENIVLDNAIRNILAQGDAVYVWYIDEKVLPHKHNILIKKVCSRCGNGAKGLTDGLCIDCEE